MPTLTPEQKAAIKKFIDGVLDGPESQFDQTNLGLTMRLGERPMNFSHDKSYGPYRGHMLRIDHRQMQPVVEEAECLD